MIDVSWRSLTLQSIVSFEHAIWSGFGSETSHIARRSDQGAETAGQSALLVI